MMIPFIYPNKPDINLYLKYLKEAIDKNQYTNFGPNYYLLKDRISTLVGTQNVVLVANATLALEGLHFLFSKKCKLAYLPSFTFPATNQGVRVKASYSKTIGEGLDIGRADWGSDLKEDSYAVTVNPFGSLNRPCQRPPNVKYWVIDNAAGLLTQTQEWLSNDADAVVYSLHATKILSACEGGVVVFKDEDLYKEYLKYINFGIFVKNKKRHIPKHGSNHKISEINTAWCLMQLDLLNDNLEKRKNIFELYKKYCENNNIKYIPSLQSFWMLNKPSKKLKKVMEIRNYYESLPIKNKCETTKLFNKHGYCYPTHSMIDDKQKIIIEKVLDLYDI